MDIGQEIIILRARKGWTQQQFAQKLNITQRTVAAWESGDSAPRNTMKVKIAQAFDLPDDHFLDTNEQTERTKNDNIKTVGQEIEEFLSKTSTEISDEKKKQLLKAFQDVIISNKNNE